MVSVRGKSGAGQNAAAAGEAEGWAGGTPQQYMGGNIFAAAAQMQNGRGGGKSGGHRGLAQGSGGSHAPVGAVTLATHDSAAALAHAGGALRGGRGRARKKPVADPELNHSSDALRKVLRDWMKAFLKRCYAPLMRSLIREFSRESSRVLPMDQVSFLWLTAFCMGFQRAQIARERRERQSSAKRRVAGVSFKWHRSPIIVTLDRWTLNFVLRSCDMYYEQKMWGNAEIAANVLREMMLVLHAMRQSPLDNVKLQGMEITNRLFYERVILDLVPRLLRGWDCMKHTRRHLGQLVELAHVLMRVAEEMAAAKQVILKKRRKKQEKAKKKSQRPAWGRRWAQEETLVLEQAVLKYTASKSLKNWEKMLADRIFGTMFREGRQPSELKARWKAINPHREANGGKGLQALLDEEAKLPSDGEDAEEDGDDEAAEGTTKKQLETLVAETEFALEPFVNLFVNNATLQNYAALLQGGQYISNTARTNYHVHRYFYIVKNAKYQGERMEPMLWHVRLLGIYEEILSDHRAASQSHVKDLRRFCAGVTRRFFAEASKNPLVVVESLFWNKKADAAALARHYQEYLTPAQNGVLSSRAARRRNGAGGLKLPSVQARRLVTLRVTRETMAWPGRRKGYSEMWWPGMAKTKQRRKGMSRRWQRRRRRRRRRKRRQKRRRRNVQRGLRTRRTRQQFHGAEKRIVIFERSFRRFQI